MFSNTECFPNTEKELFSKSNGTQITELEFGWKTAIQQKQWNQDDDPVAERHGGEGEGGQPPLFVLSHCLSRDSSLLSLLSLFAM